MASPAVPQQAACNYQPFPAGFQMSAGHCAPQHNSSNGIVPNPNAFPQGSGIPAAMVQPPSPIAAQRGGMPQHMTPSQAPISAEHAKAQYQRGVPAQQPIANSVQQPGSPQVAQVAATQNGYYAAAAAEQQQQQPQGKVNMHELRANSVAINRELLGNLAKNVKTRRVYVDFSFSCAEAAQNPTCVKKFIIEPNVFRLSSLDPSGKSRTGKLETGIVVEARLLSATSDCRKPLAVQISGVKGNTYSCSGKRMAFPLHGGGNCSINYGEKGMRIHRITDNVDVHNLDRYGHLSIESVKKTVMAIGGEDFSLVEIHSPVMDLIRVNSVKLRCEPDGFFTVGKRFHVINNDVIQACLTLMDNSFFNRMPFTDLGKFSVEVQPMSGEWTSTQGLVDYDNGGNSESTAMLVQDALVKCNTVGMWLEIDYLLHHLHTKPAVAPAQLNPGFQQTAPAQTAAF